MWLAHRVQYYLHTGSTAALSVQSPGLLMVSTSPLEAGTTPCKSGVLNLARYLRPTQGIARSWTRWPGLWTDNTSLREAGITPYRSGTPSPVNICGPILDTTLK